MPNADKYCILDLSRPKIVIPASHRDYACNSDDLSRYFSLSRVEKQSRLSKTFYRALKADRPFWCSTRAPVNTHRSRLRKSPRLRFILSDYACAKVGLLFWTGNSKDVSFAGIQRVSNVVKSLFTSTNYLVNNSFRRARILSSLRMPSRELYLWSSI